MKIAYSIASIENSGGIERVLCTKANYFADILGYEVHFIVLKKTQTTFFPFSQNIMIHSLEVNELNHKPWMILGSSSKREYKQKLFQKLEEIKPDVTISVFGLDAEFLYQSKDGSKKVLEFHFTKNYLMHLGNALKNDKYKHIRKYWLKFLQWKETYYAGKYNHIVLLTHRDKNLWGNHKKFQVIPNPLSFTSDKTAALDNKLIVSMGRLVYPKGFDYLIRSFALLYDKYPDWKVVIYGDGQDKELLQNEINNLSLHDSFILKDPEIDVEKIMLEASIFVLPSLYDGFGLVLTEAMACGVPCVAFDCECGPSEIITENKDGFLVETKNILALTEKIELLMQDKQLRLQMGSESKKNVMRFDVPVIMNQWVEYLAEVIE